jgi:hypothetical protein
MRKLLIALGATAFAFGSMSMLTMPAEAAKGPAKTAKGCIIGKEKWDAKEGKCMASAPAKAAKKAG